MQKNKKRGIVQSFNVSPKGAYEGLLVESDRELLQMNFPQEWSSAIAAMANVGDHIEAEVEAQEAHAHASHPVYQLLRLSNDKQQTFPQEHTSESRDGHFSGTVERLNFALHGEVNGAILNSGDFLHLKPHGAAAVGLTVGMKVKGKGPAKPMVGERRVIEAEEVNGIQMEKKPKPKKKAHH